jgi:hypothetical protein
MRLKFFTQHVKMMQQVSVEITMKQDPWLFDGVFE